MVLAYGITARVASHAVTTARAEKDRLPRPEEAARANNAFGCDLYGALRAGDTTLTPRSPVTARATLEPQTQTQVQHVNES